MRNRYPFTSALLMLGAAVAFALMLAIGFYVRDTNNNTRIEQREVREHRIANERSHHVLCANQKRIGEALGIDGQLECPEPRHFDESGLGF